MSNLLTKTRQWAVKAEQAMTSALPTALSVRGSLKEMRELLHSGERLGVLIPGVERLRREIRRREWEEQVKRTLAVGHTCMGAACPLRPRGPSPRTRGGQGTVPNVVEGGVEGYAICVLRRGA